MFGFSNACQFLRIYRQSSTRRKKIDRQMQRKITSFGLVIYVLVLLTQPCEDVFAFPSQLDQSETASILIDAPNDREPETCSPFCICGCCSLSVASHTFTSLESIETVIHSTPKAPLTYRNLHGATYLSSVWQPPKV